MLLIFINSPKVFSQETAAKEHANNWSLYDCYIVSGAIKMAAFKNGELLSKVNRDKGRFYIQVSMENNTVFGGAYFAGFPLKVGSQAKITIDDTQEFLLYSHQKPKANIEKSYAWTLPDDDGNLINALKKGQEAIIESNSHTGKVIKDTFALTGFTKAYNLLRNTCK